MRPRRPVAEGSPRKRLGNGVVKRAVVGVLSAADRELTVAAVQVRVEECLGRPISKDSVRSCLSTDVRGQEPRFERTSPGRYRLSGDA
jgi:hypothetical protein